MRDDEQFPGGGLDDFDFAGGGGAIGVGDRNRVNREAVERIGGAPDGHLVIGKIVISFIGRNRRNLRQRQGFTVKRINGRAKGRPNQKAGVFSKVVPFGRVDDRPDA